MAQTATPTLAQLRQEVRVRLMDFAQPPAFLDAVYDYEINRQLDLWTRDTSMLEVNYLTDIIAGVNPTILTPLPGYQLGEILNMAIKQNGHTIVNLDIRTPKEMYRQFPDWPNTQTNAATPMFAVFDFDPNTSGHVLHNAVTLWPGPSQSLTAADSGGAGGLVVTCKAITDGLLINDGDALPLLARHAKEPIIEGVCATLLARTGNELATYHDAVRRAESEKIRRTAGRERRQTRAVTTYNV